MISLFLETTSPSDIRRIRIFFLTLLFFALSTLTQSAAETGGPGAVAPGAVVRTTSAEGITFAANPGRFYLPVDEAGKHLGWEVKHDKERQTVTLNGITFATGELRNFLEGPRLVHMTHLIRAGADIEKSEDGKLVTVTAGKRRFHLYAGDKRVKVDLTTQNLKAWQGKRLVLDCHISSGRYGTPTGDYKAGPYKARHHYSSLFNRAPMPYSVQFHGHYFIHGFTSVPDYPASHGCIRMHLDRGNPAGFFYDWVDVGTPITVFRSEKKAE